MNSVRGGEERLERRQPGLVDDSCRFRSWGCCRRLADSALDRNGAEVGGGLDRNPGGLGRGVVRGLDNCKGWVRWVERATRVGCRLDAGSWMERDTGDPGAGAAAPKP